MKRRNLLTGFSVLALLGLAWRCSWRSIYVTADIDPNRLGSTASMSVTVDELNEYSVSILCRPETVAQFHVEIEEDGRLIADTKTHELRFSVVHPGNKQAILLNRTLKPGPYRVRVTVVRAHHPPETFAPSSVVFAKSHHGK